MPSWDVFVAYATPDHAHAARLVRALAPHRAVFWDQTALRGAEVPPFADWIALTEGGD
jgi:hypothetical protein